MESIGAKNEPEVELKLYRLKPDVDKRKDQTPSSIATTNKNADTSSGDIISTPSPVQSIPQSSISYGIGNNIVPTQTSTSMARNDYDRIDGNDSNQITDNENSTPSKVAKRNLNKNESIKSTNTEALLEIYSNELKALRNKNKYDKQYKLVHVNKPSSANWKQQKMQAWQPVIRPKPVIFTFLVVGIALISIGIAMYISINNIKEIVVDYTDCTWVMNSSMKCSDVLQTVDKCQCELQIYVEENIPSPVFVYYSLNGFYQNHRLYTASVDYDQLYGRDVSLKNLRKHCEPFSDIDGNPIAPCGVIANTMFRDEFSIYWSQNDSVSIPIEQIDIVWPQDRDNIFRNPPMDKLDSYEKPKNWTKKVTDLDPMHPENNGFLNGHFIVWMRTAAFPEFRKLWGKLEVKEITSNPYLPFGEYRIRINYYYKTVTENLRIPKKIILSNTSWLGGKNFFLPILYIVTGVFSLLFAVFFIFITVKYGKTSRISLSKANKVNYKATDPVDVRVGVLPVDFDSTTSQERMEQTET